MIPMVPADRVRALELGSGVVSMLMTGRPRALLLPGRLVGRMGPGDAWWVQESIHVDARQRRRDELRFRYAAGGQVGVVGWPAAIAPPGAGMRPAAAMPIQCSRFTLVIESVSVVRLVADVTDDLAYRLGLVQTGAAEWHAPLVPQVFGAQESAADAVLTLWEWMHGARESKASGEVLEVGVRVVARNVRHLVPGLGHGGVQ